MTKSRAWIGPVATVVTLAILEAGSRTGFKIPNPAPVYFTVIVFSAMYGGIGPGLLSAAIAFVYSIYFFASPGVWFSFSPDNLTRVSVLAVTAPLVAVLVGTLQSRAKRLVDSEKELELAREKQRSQEEQGRINDRYTVVLKHMPQGVCLFDENQRLVLMNERYVEITGIVSSKLSAGASLREVIAEGAQSGAYTGERSNFVEEAIRAYSDKRPSSRVLKWINGRVVRIHRHPLPEGGWLTTHEDITEFQRAVEHATYLTHHDVLTGLLNRKSFIDQLNVCLVTLGAEDEVAVLHVGLDGFSNLHEVMGRDISEGVIKTMATRLTQCTHGTHLVSRVGGGDFAIAQVRGRQPVTATELARRIFNAMSNPFQIGAQAVDLKASIGIAIGPKDGDNAEDLVRNADIALNRAKAESGGQYRFFEAELDAAARTRRALELDLRKALTSDHLDVHYQPIINLPRNEVSGFEALARWHHPERGRVSPAEFIPIAEEAGLIVALGEWVLRKACCDAATWPDNLKLSVNLSPIQLTTGIGSAVASALAVSGLEPSRLELEITETALLQDTEATLAALHELHGLRVRVSMDDFGTGYSSFSYLRRFPFDTIKIDRSFVTDLPTSNHCLAIVRAVAGLARSLNIETTAEGVETVDQLKVIAEEGCDNVQGFLFSGAVPANEVPAIMSKIERDLTQAA